MAGRPPAFSDADILRLFKECDWPSMSTQEVADALKVSRGGIHPRLKELRGRGYLDSRRCGPVRLWWLTRAGEVFLSHPHQS